MPVESHQVTWAVSRRTAAAAGAVLVLSLGCGWLFKSWSISEEAASASTRRSSTDLPSDSKASRQVVDREGETANLFLGRLHDVLGLRAKARRARAILALADGMSPAPSPRHSLAPLSKKPHWPIDMRSETLCLRLWQRPTPMRLSVLLWV